MKDRLQLPPWRAARSTAAAGDGLILSGPLVWFDTNHATGTATSTSAAATAAARCHQLHSGSTGGVLPVRAASSSPAVCGRADGSGDSARSTVWMNPLGRSGRTSRSRLTRPRDARVRSAIDRRPRPGTRPSPFCRAGRRDCRRPTLAWPVARRTALARDTPACRPCRTAFASRSRARCRRRSP